MSRFHSLKVKDVRKETADCVSVAFEIPKELQTEFEFKPGQHLTFKFNVNGEELRRSYSICTSPYDKEVRVAIKKVSDGRVSRFVNDNIKVGDVVETMPPAGTFTVEFHPYNKKTYNLFSGGSGITPSMSILKTVLEFESQAIVNLFYGNVNEDTIIFKKELEALKAKYQTRLNIYHTLDAPKEKREELLTGRIDKEKATAFVKKFINTSALNECFICGPGVMIQNVKEALEESGIPKNKIHIEYFGTPPDAATETADKTLFVPAEVTIICDGDERVVFVEPHQTLLEAALEANLDAPFACRGGSCCTCRAKIIEGKVLMDVNYALSESEVEEGYVLTCQSHCITPTVTFDYDQGK